jgi:hypothetical protein
VIALTPWFWVAPAWAGEANLPSVGLYYGSGPAPAGFHDFDWIIVNPGQKRLPSDFPQQQVFSYVSIGETTPGDSRYAKLPADCVLGTDASWGGKIINLAKSTCRSYLLQQVIDPIWTEGYRGFFLDTLDSYEAVTQGDARIAQENGLVALIRAIKKAHPQAKLIANRGFAVLPKIHQDLVGLLAESLYRSWNQSEHRFTEVPEAERKALLGELHKAQAYGLPVIVVDYMPSTLNREGWWEDAERIRAAGFIPYVTNPELTAVGAGLREPMPRKVLMLFNSTQPEEFSAAFANGAMPLEYLGYIPEFRRLSDSMPPKPVPGEYAGVVVWSGGNPVDDVAALSKWIEDAKDQGIPILLLGDFQAALDTQAYRALGMVPPSSIDTSSVRLVNASQEMQYEMPVEPNSRDFLAIQAPAGSQVWLQLQDTAGDATEDVAAITPWGGYVLSPYLLTTLPNKDTRWLVDPFALYRQALRLPKMPVPDTTTESGRRLFMAHADGDGFVSRADFPPYHIAGQVYMDRILKKYRLPFTGSIIVGDLLPGDRGLYPALAPLGTRVAREIFRLPYVEIGSHMWSHPFDWPAIEAGKDYPGINLPVPGYKFSPYMEAVGAAKWIDQHLAPPDKKVVIDQWSGDCEPDAQVVGLAYTAGLENINGGTSYISKKNPSITAVPPIGIFRGKWLQVFAPDANEDYFTNQWHGPYWGYINVIQTFEMTDKPHRLKPIDIYTHWYTATKLASLSALEKVYDWVLNQSITPIYVADYAKIANNFFTIHIAREGHGFWIGGAHALRELRMPDELGYPDLQRSSGIAGYNPSPNGRRYVHMDGSDSVHLALQETPPQNPYIASANAAISAYQQTASGLTAQLDGSVPVALQLANVRGCRATVNGRAVAIGSAGQLQSTAHRIELDVQCP